MKKLLICILFVGLFLSGCRKTENNNDVPQPRTISLSPAITQIISDMGFDNHLVGVTNFCEIRDGLNIPRVGDAKSINNEQILSLNPDMIICQGNLRLISGIKQFNKELAVEKVAIESLNDIPSAALKIGRLMGNEETGLKYHDTFLSSIGKIKEQASGLKKKRVLFVMGIRSPTIAAEGSFIHDMIHVAGGVNGCDKIPGQPRWREATIESIHKTEPDVIICQIFNPAEKQSAVEFWAQWKDIPAVQNKKVFVVDDPNWTIPSLRIVGYCEKLFEFIHGN